MELQPGQKGRKPQLKPTRKHLRVPTTELPSLTEEVAFPDNSLTNSLVKHIEQHKIPVQITQEVTPSQGNCFYEAVALLCKKNKIHLRNGTSAPHAHLLLRQAVCNTLDTHP